MVFKLTNEQITELLAFQALGDFDKIYENLANWGFGKEGVNPASIAWLDGAARINRGEGAYSELIRNYTGHQHTLRYGTGLSQADLQRLSNDIAGRVLATIIASHDDPNIVDIPTIAAIGNQRPSSLDDGR